jgi:hypothetical protein
MTATDAELATPLDLYAVIQCHLDGDAASIGALVAQVDVGSLLALSITLLCALVGEDRLREMILDARRQAMLG